MSMRATYAFLAIQVIAAASSAQQPSSSNSPSVLSSSNGSPNSAGSLNSAGTPGGTDNGRVVRDPVTGRVFYQQWVTETVPVVRWENKQITTTVYENQTVNQVVPTNQTVFQPQTQYVLQPYWKGAWNPFQQPILAYQSKPVTTWVPTTTASTQVVTRQQVVPKQQTITVPQPITETKTQQRLVQTEIPQPGVALAGPARPLGAYTASQPPAWINVSRLARQPFAPSASPVNPNYAANPAANRLATAPSSHLTQTAPVANGWTGGWNSGWTASKSPYSSTIQSNYTGNIAQGNIAQGNIATSQFTQGQYTTHQYATPTPQLRPVARMMQTIFPPTYNAPMRTASSHGGSWNQMQSGMAPTVLR